jgi:HSP90 family molecular chaperone
MDEVKNSAFLEKLLAKDLEVIFFTDPIDEYLMQNLTEFDDKKFANASKEDLKFDDKDDDEKAKEKKVKEQFKVLARTLRLIAREGSSSAGRREWTLLTWVCFRGGGFARTRHALGCSKKKGPPTDPTHTATDAQDLTKWWKNTLTTEEVENVKISNRLASTPCIVVTSKYGWSANMERIMKSQALSGDQRASYMKGRKTLEINPRHPLIRELKARVGGGEDVPAAVTRAAKLLYDTALLESGFMLDDPKAFSEKVFSIVGESLDIPEDAGLEDIDLPEEEEEEADVEAEEAEVEEAEAVHDEL